MMLPDAKAILDLVRSADDKAAADLIDQYARTVASIAVAEAVAQAFDHAMALFTPPAERGQLQ